MLELWGMRSTPSLISLSGPLQPKMVAPDRVQFMCQLELSNGLILLVLFFAFKLRIYAKLNCLK